MRIRTFQSGGDIVYLPTSNRIGAAPQQAASTDSGESKVPGFTKELITIVKENGLDSDVTVYLDRLGRMLNLANDPTGENVSMRDILQAQKLANRVKQNYADYKEAYKSLESQDAWAEPATTARGWLYVQDTKTNKIKAVSPTEYNPEEHLSLTNQDLIHLRRSNPSMAFDDDILDNLNSAVGMKTITDYAKNIIEAFGKTTITGYSEKQANNIKTGMDNIVSGVLASDPSIVRNLITAGPDGMYKITKEATVADTHLQEALNYIVSALPNNYLNTLKAKAAAENYKPDALLAEMLMYNTDRSVKADYDNTATGSSESGSGDSKKDNQHTLAETYADGQNANIPEWPNITPANSAVTLQAYAQNVGPVYADNSGNPGNPIGTVNLPQLFEDAYGVRSVTRNRSVSFGDQLINENDLGGVVYDGSDMYRVVLPAKTINGGKDIVPDFELQQKLDEIIENAESQNLTPELISKYLQQECPGATYDKENKTIILPPSKRHVFLTFQAHAADNYIDFNADSDYLAKSDFNVDAYKEAVKYGYSNHKKGDLERVSGNASDNTWFARTRNHLYKGNIFIPVISAMAGTMKYNQEYVPRSQYTNITGRAIEHERDVQIQQDFRSGARSTSWAQ